MNLIFELISILLCGHNKQFIVNYNKPICSNCQHFITGPVPARIELGKCNKFGTMDLVSGTVNYRFAENCRNRDEYCGEKGYYFVERNVSNENNSLI